MSHSPAELVNLFASVMDAYSPYTINGYAADLTAFVEWCRRNDQVWFPARAEIVAEFIDDQIRTHCVSTIKRRLCAIAFLHRLRDLPSPSDAHVVRLAVRRACRKKPSRPKQVGGLTNEIRVKIIKACPKTLAGVRDAALINVGYDTLCRSSEIAAMRVEHLDIRRYGTAVMLIPRSKNDTAGDGRVAYLSPGTTSLLKRWLTKTGLKGGPLFTSLHLGRLYQQALDTSSIRRLIKRAAQRAGITADLSGHSMRIGAAQDMMVAGFDALAIMQAGGWKSGNIVLRYVEKASTRALHDRRWERLQRFQKCRPP